jgi:hypothetical protein
VDADTTRIREFERAFRRDGLPNLIVDLSAAEDIFTRAMPFLALVFAVEIVNALDINSGWANLVLALCGTGVLIGAFGAANVVRGRRFLSISTRVGIPELVMFVVLPGLLPMLLSRRFLVGLSTILVNVAILVLVYMVVGFGLIAIVRWACVRLFAQLAASRSLLVRAVPPLLFFSLVMFFTQEIWAVFTATGQGVYWTAIGLFVLLGVLVLSGRLPAIVGEMEAELNGGGVPLRRRERLNLAAVALISESLQVLFVSAAVWLFYVLVGTLLVSADVRGAWLGQPGTVIWEVAWFGEHVQVTSELLRVATGVAAFAGLYYAVAILVDSAYRDQFVDGLSRELRDTFRRRSEYLNLLKHRGVAAEPNGLSVDT